MMPVPAPDWLVAHTYRRGMVDYVEQRQRSADVWWAWRRTSTSPVWRSRVRAARRFVHTHGFDMVDVDPMNPHHLDLSYLQRRAKKCSARLKKQLAKWRVPHPGAAPVGFDHVGPQPRHPPSKPRSIPAELAYWVPKAARLPRTLS